jgi:predicted RNase H-like nuclease (RuvC/YqgF family)
MELKHIFSLVVAAVLSSSLITEVVRQIFNRKLNKVQKDAVIVNMYSKLMDGLRQELDRLSAEVETLRKKEVLFLENQTLWIKRNDELYVKLQKVEEINNEQTAEIEKHKNQIQEQQKQITSQRQKIEQLTKNQNK